MRTTMLMSLLACALMLTGCANKQLGQELATARGDLETLRAELDACTDALKKADAAAAGAKTAQALAEERLETYRALAEKLRAAFGDQGLDIILRNGRLVVQLPNAILFDSGKRDLKPDGKETLRKLAGVLKTVKNRRFLVAGHTDNVPVAQKAKGFRSNWELSTLRATTAVEFLVSESMSARQLAAGGYGEFLPTASNDDEAGRARNRRLEIIVMPNASEIPPMPKTL